MSSLQILFCWTLAFVGPAFCQNTLQAANYVVRNETISPLQEELARISNVHDYLRCGITCVLRADCDGANYNLNAKTCSLLRSGESSALVLLRNSEFIYMKKFLGGTLPTLPGVLDHLSTTSTATVATATVATATVATATVATATVATSLPTPAPVSGGSSTCKQYYDAGNRASMAYTHVDQTKSTSTDVYCHMGDIPGCGTGGWTLIMRINGAETTFKYNSQYWENTNTYNPGDGSSGFTVHKETLLPTYWSTPFTKICVGMKNKTGSGVKWLLINKIADSLHGLLADGTMKETNLGIQTWKDMFPEQVLQNACQREGFNAQGSTEAKARIGVIGDDASSCSQPDSNLGIGIQGWWNNQGDSSCGSGSKDDQYISTWCFVFVQ